MIFGAILAGGVGSRMRLADMPKQFLPLGNRPVIIHTLERFLECESLDKIYVGVHASWIDFMDEILDQHLCSFRDRICVVSGGADRNGTIFNIIAAIEEHFGESEDHIIVTHDSVRPFVDLRIIEKNIVAAKEYGAVDTVMPASDTIVVSENGQTISDIPNRSKLYQGQTPQSFKISLLKSLFATLTDDEKGILTDASKICVIRNYPVHMVMGSDINMKITTPGDYEIAKALVMEK